MGEHFVLFINSVGNLNVPKTKWSSEHKVKEAEGAEKPKVKSGFLIGPFRAQ
jgi:hypothetical protein